MKRRDIKKRDKVIRDNFEGLDATVSERLLKERDEQKRAINAVIGVVMRIEKNGRFAHVKWLGRHATTREPLSRLTAIRRKGVRR